MASYLFFQNLIDGAGIEESFDVKQCLFQAV